MAGSRSLERFYKYLDYIFPVYFSVYFVEYYFGYWRLSTIIKLLCILLSLFYAVRVYNKAESAGKGKHLFNIFYAYTVLSVIMYAINGVSFRCYLNELYNSIPAMFFFYIGMADNRGDSFYRKLLNAITISLAVGLVLYLLAPGWFVARKSELISMQWFGGTNYSDEQVLEGMRFSAFFTDSYEVSMYSMVALSISLFLFFVNKTNKQTVLGISVILISFVSAILCQQRIAMASASFTLLFYLLYGNFKKHGGKSLKLTLTLGLIAILVVSLALTLFQDRVGQLTELLTERSEGMSVSKAWAERSYQTDLITKHWHMPIFGHGIGAGGAMAGQLRYPHVNDAGWLELLYEYGLVGTFIFLLLIVQSLLRGVRLMRYYLTELVIVAFVLLAMVGSNTLTLGYMQIIPFWYSLGRIWSKGNYDYIRLNKVFI